MKEERIVSFGLKSDSLPFFLAQFMAFEEKKIIIISPYITQFNLTRVDLESKEVEDSQTSFFDLISKLTRSGIKITIYTTKGYAEKLIKSNDFKFKRGNLEMRVADNLHEKFVITSFFFYKGSANITYSGLYNKIENCEIGLVKDNQQYLNKVVYELEGQSKLFDIS